MHFPGDALFLDRKLSVPGITEPQRSWRVASRYRPGSALELSTGECAQRGLEVSDRLELPDRKTAHSTQSDAPDAAKTQPQGPKIARVTHGQGGELARLQPLGVLIISRDRHFRTVMSLLLARRNCSVTTTAKASRVTELIARECADVVLIDASRLPADATVATVEALARPVGMVIVADEAHPELSHPRVLAKWGPFTDLVAAIERADEHRGARRHR